MAVQDSIRSAAGSGDDKAVLEAGFPGTLARFSDALAFLQVTIRALEAAEQASEACVLESAFTALNRVYGELDALAFDTGDRAMRREMSSSKGILT